VHNREERTSAHRHDRTHDQRQLRMLFSAPIPRKQGGLSLDPSCPLGPKNHFLEQVCGPQPLRERGSGSWCGINSVEWVVDRLTSCAQQRRPGLVKSTDGPDCNFCRPIHTDPLDDQPLSAEEVQR